MDFVTKNYFEEKFKNLNETLKTLSEKIERLERGNNVEKQSTGSSASSGEVGFVAAALM